MVGKNQKVWGMNNEMFRNSSCSVNVLYIKKDTQCSWHYHRTKYNVFYVISGCIKIRTERGSRTLVQGDMWTVEPGAKHLFEGEEDSVVIEVMYVEYDHDDIERLILGKKLEPNDNLDRIIPNEPLDP